MLSFEEIEDCFPNGAVSLPDGWIGVTAQWMHDLARAIEAAVLPEGWVAVPRIVTPAIEAVYSNDSGAYGTAQELHDAMIAAAPQPAKAQASPLDLMECLQDRPVEPSKVVQGKCVTQAEKQEPVGCPAFGDMDEAAEFVGALGLMECLQDRPVAPSKAVQGKCVVQAEKQEPNCGHESCDCRGYCEKQEPVKDEPVFEVGFGWLQDADKFGRGTNLYTRPQDLTAEVERLKAERDSFYMDYRMKCDLETKQQAERIAELEAQDTEMCDVHAQLLVEHGKAKLHIAALEEAARRHGRGDD